MLKIMKSVVLRRMTCEEDDMSASERLFVQIRTKVTMICKVHLRHKIILQDNLELNHIHFTLI